MDMTKFTSNNSENLYVDSTVPEVCKSKPCVLGVDEAGRGPVLGPMVYGVCYCPVGQDEDLKKLGAADSKTLTEVQREKLFEQMNKNNDYIGWSIEIISPVFISNCMYKRPKVSLNEVSHNSAIGLIKRVIAAGANIQQVFVDTVGPPEKYQDKLQAIFPTLEITVSKKADALFPSVSAASICAKVARDKALKEWQFPEGIDGGQWGSGYPGDGVTKNFLHNTLEPVFGFPGVVRFSWSTAEKILESKGVAVSWAEEEDEDASSKENTPSVLDMFAQQQRPGGGSSSTSEKEERRPSKKARHFYFTDRCLKPTQTL
uniref:Ribonuclease n=1 Tax=Hirondellea gigas TaxID=1518452 RepID=A0A2P2I321_9CRUS